MRAIKLRVTSRRKRLLDYVTRDAGLPRDADGTISVPVPPAETLLVFSKQDAKPVRDADANYAQLVERFGEETASTLVDIYEARVPSDKPAAWSLKDERLPENAAAPPAGGAGAAGPHRPVGAGGPFSLTDPRDPRDTRTG